MTCGQMAPLGRSHMNGAIPFERSSPVPLPDFYFDSFSYPVAPIVSSARGIV